MTYNLEQTMESIERMSVRNLQEYVNNNLTAMFQDRLNDVLYQVATIKVKEGDVQ